MKTFTVVAALEFGNSYSGYAFSNKSAFETNPPNISINPPWTCDNKAFLEKRTSTSVLFNSAKKVQYIGYEAESCYARYDEAVREEYYFFRLFQKKLINKDFRSSTFCTEVLGKQLSFEIVVIAFITALADKCKQQIRTSYGNLNDDEIRWVITVPADLNPSAEQFMKECVEKANILPDQFTLVTETEAAFAYSQKLLQSDRYSKLEERAEYMIVDLGVHEADISVVKNDNGEMIEKYRKTRTEERVSAHDYFRKILCRKIGGEVMKILVNDRSVYQDIERGFEEFKLSAIGKKQMRVPLPLNIEESLGPYLRQPEMKWQIEDHKLVFLEDTIKEILKNEIDGVITQMENVFQSYRDAHTISFIVMTGDFYQCCLVKNMVEIKFPQKHTIFSESNEEAVMKGAVISGWQPYDHTYEMIRAYDKPIGTKGFLLVINFFFPNEERKRTGSLGDVKKLKDFFTEPKYEVECYEDMKKEDLQSKLVTIRNHLEKNADRYHSFICVVMSHGNQKGIETTNNDITVDELITPFKNDVAQGFIGKPKIFLLQACLGKKDQALNEYDNRKLANDYSAVLRMPTDADIIIIYATTPGYVSIRRTKSPTWTGAWFIHAFLSVAEKYRNNHLLEILTAVNFELANNPEYVFGDNKCQVSMSDITLSKLFYI